MTDTALLLLPVEVSEEVPENCIAFVPPRRTIGGDMEPLEDWLKRCALITNIGVPK